MKKQLFLLVMMLLPMVARADAVEIDGIYYNIFNTHFGEPKVAYVASNPNKYSGDIVIPSTIIYDGVVHHVTTIDESAFSNCSDLTSISIPNSVTSIYAWAFFNCSGLTSIPLPNSLTHIDKNAFSSCTSLTSITIPNSVNYIAERAFRGCTGLRSISIPNGVQIIFDETFADCSGLTSVIIPNSVTTIKTGAFSGCTNLTSVNIPNSVTEIGVSAFLGCENLTSVTIPNSVTTIDRMAFMDCSKISSLSIGNSVKSINDGAFSGCSGLSSLTIPSSVTKIGENAFYCCSSLTTISVDIKNSYYDSRENCNAIIETSNNELILGCQNTIIPNSVTSIGHGAFRECSGLTSISIPSSVTSIGSYAFDDCNNLTSIDISDLAAWCRITFAEYSFTNDHRLFLNGEEIKELVIPNSVTSIGNYAFSCCSGLTSVTIPNSVTNIGYEAFYGCSGLTSVTIGSGIKTIDNLVFVYCYELTDVYCYAKEVPSTHPNAFETSGIEYATLHVLDASIDLYKAVEPWKNFKEIVALEGDTPPEPGEKKCATPSITYINGEIVFSCETEGVSYVYSCDKPESQVGKVESKFTPDTKYTVIVFATKEGWEDSDIATAEIDVRGLAGQLIKGDTNGDGVVDISDAVGLVNIILEKNE